MDSARGSDLVFFDPDNGMEVKSARYGVRDSSKYLYWREVAEAYRRGHSLLIYQHFPRIPREPFLERLAGHLRSQTGAPLVISFGTSNVAFLLALQPGHTEAARKSAVVVARQWDGQMTIGEYGAG